MSSSRIRGAVSEGQPRIRVFLEVKALGKSGKVDFVIDTGATYSALSEHDALLLGIDVLTLPKEKGRGIGFSGVFTPRLLNREIGLTFYDTQGDLYRLKKSGLHVITAPEDVDEDTRREVVARTLPYWATISCQDLNCT